MIIDTTSLEAGEEHTLVLQSFDQASNGVESTLKTDSITIVIIESVPALATFTQSLAAASIISGIESNWTLPDIDSGNVALTEVRLDTDSLILENLKYDSVANKIHYDGEELNALKAMRLVTLNITLVNSFGETPYSQLVIVSPNQDSLLSLEPEE